MREGTRYPYLILFVGARGTGKTTRMLALAKEIGRRALLYTSARNDAKLAGLPVAAPPEMAYGVKQPKKGQSAICRLDFDIDSAAAWTTCQGYTEGTLMIDDTEAFTSGRVNESDTVRMLKQLRHNSVDLLMNFHHLDEVPPAFYRFADHLVLFKQPTPPTRWEKLPPRDKLLPLYEYVRGSTDRYECAFLSLLEAPEPVTV